MKTMELWDRVKVTDPRAVKKITGKPYQGDSPKPYWLIERATEEFGPCGEGWGVEVKSEGFHRMTDTDVMHTAVVVVWYMRNEKRCVVEQMGQTKACYAKSGGGMMLDEDAGKKSVTDGMVKCLSMIGFAGDIFSGQWNDSKYVEWAADETARRYAATGEPEAPAENQPSDMSPKARAARMTAGVAHGDAEDVANVLASMNQAAIDAIWQHFDPATIDAITAVWPKGN